MARFCFQESELSSFRLFYSSVTVLLPTILLLTITASAVGQSSAPPVETLATDPTMARIERARALAAAHQLRSAAGELESARAAALNDASVRNITTLMLISIYLEEGNYVRPMALLDEAFQYRATQKDDSVRTYFALAGQAINGVRTKLARYRSFGINIGDSNLPQEALKDIEQIRFLLERLVAQANDLTSENGSAYDAWALKEDVLGIRISIARDLQDRGKWQAEHEVAREKLASRQIQIASIGRPPVLEAVTAKIPNPFSSSKSTDSSETDAGSDVSTSSSPAAPASDPKPYNTIEGGSLSGREHKRVTPLYPQIAKSAGVTGVVRVFVVIDENGNVMVKRSEGPSLLRRAAEDAAGGWSFAPTQVNNQLVRISGYIDFEFKL